MTSSVTEIASCWDPHDGVVQLSVSGARAMKAIATVAAAVIFGNVLFGCMFSVPCQQLLPTISYLGCFPGHERLHVLSCVGFSMGLLVLYLGATVRLYDAVPPFTRFVSFFLALGITASLGAIPIVDEVNGLYFAPLDWMHSYVVIALLVFSYCWVYLIYGSLSDLRESLGSTEKTHLDTLRKVIWAEVAVTIFAIIEWQGAYSLYSNSFLNENWQALCEWCAVGLGLSLPVYFCRVFDGFQVTLTIPQYNTHSDPYYQEFESEDSKP